MLRNIENQSGCPVPGNKRNAEEMMQLAGQPVISPSVETVTSDTQSDTENYASKRPKVKDDNESTVSRVERNTPSRVIHVRNLPPDASESDITALAARHGQVINLILMRNKRQAFVEMKDVKQAVNMVRHHQHPQNQAEVRGHPVQMQFSSTYSELKPGQRTHANGMKPTAVLHVNVDNLHVPVTLAVFHQIFSRFGLVQKIITFNKNNQFQALIQMSDVQSAEAAKASLDGRNVYTSCCLLRIDFSKMISINVKYNNDKSRDFTNPELPSGEEGGIQVVGTSPPAMGPMLNAVRPLSGICLAPNVNPAAMVSPMPAVHPLQGYRMMSAVNPTLLQGYGLPTSPVVSAAFSGRPMQLSPPRLPIGQAEQQSTNQLQLQQMMNQLPSTANRLPVAANQPTTTNSTPLQLAQVLNTPRQEAPLNGQQGLPDLQNQQMFLSHIQARHQLLQRYAVPQAMGSPALPSAISSLSSTDVHSPSPGSNTGSPVVLVSNLNPQKVSPDALFTLFGVYGNVMRVKILYHKLDTAMVQYSDANGAHTACKHLDRVIFWQSEIRVILSKHSSIQMPSPDSNREGSKLTRDYTNSDLHRFTKLNSRNYANISSPCSTLHLSNLPDGIDEKALVSEFSKYGTVLGFKFFIKDKRMALIYMSDVSEAIEALMNMHNYAIKPAHHICVSFSKSIGML